MIKFKSNVWLSLLNWIIFILGIGIISEQGVFSLPFVLPIMTTLIYLESRRRANDFYVFNDKIVIKNHIKKVRHEYKYDDIIQVYFDGIKEKSILIVTFNERKRFSICLTMNNYIKFVKVLEKTGLKIKHP